MTRFSLPNFVSTPSLKVVVAITSPIAFHQLKNQTILHTCIQAAQSFVASISGAHLAIAGTAGDLAKVADIDCEKIACDPNKPAELAAALKSAVGSIVTLFSEIVTELPTPKFSTTVPATPAAPTASAQASVSNDLVSWTAPADGGKAISGYTWASSDSKGGSTASTSVTVSQEGGTAQTYTVYATNANGNSATSAASGSVTSGKIA